VSERSPEVSFDAFGPPTEPVHVPPHVTQPEPEEFDLSTVMETAMAEHEAMVEEDRVERPRVKNVTPKPRYPMAVIWGSATGGQGHVVAVIGVKPDGGPVLRCTCEAAILGGRDCWAVEYTRLMLE
jgi:hypothetical protein